MLKFENNYEKVLRNSKRVVSLGYNKTKQLKIRKMKKVFIHTIESGYSFMHFFNSTEIYSRKGFDTKRKAVNYAKKYGYEIVEKLPENIQA